MNIRAQLFKWSRLSPYIVKKQTIAKERNTLTARLDMRTSGHVVLRTRSSYCGRGSEDHGYSSTSSPVPVSDFNSHWIKVFEEHEISDPFWSVKWITEHVQRIDQSDSSAPPSSNHVSTKLI